MKLFKKIKNLFNRKPKIIVVLGQTATGKSDLAIEIAKQFNGEIISADSRQVYRGMDLGSGKVTNEEMQGVPHHLLDVANPNETFDVIQFQKLATKAIEEIISRGKNPIICGGTGFYIDALVYQTQFNSVKPNTKLREELEKLPLKELQKILKEKSKKIFNRIDIKNPIRIIRAIEIINELGSIPKIKKNKPYKSLFIGLKLPKKELDERIYKRILTRIDDGMIEEVRTLIDNGILHKRLQSFGLEYRFISRYILKEINYNEMIENLYIAIVHFAKRQKTWFKRNKNINWFNPSDSKEINDLIKSFLDKR